MDYIENLKHAIKLWWENKLLWVFGIILSIFMGSGGVNYNSNNSKQFNQAIEKLRDIPMETWIIIGVVSCSVLLIWILISMYLGYRAQAALYKSSQKIYKGEKISFKQGWESGKPYWFKAVILGLLFSAPIIIFIVIIAAIFGFLLMQGALDTTVTFSIIFGLCLVICLFFLVVLIIGIISSFIYMEMIFKDRGIVESIKYGFYFFRDNFKDILISALVSLIVSIPIGIIYAIITFVIALPMLLLMLGTFIALMETNFVLAIVIICLLGIPLEILLRSISGPIFAFSSMYWTVVYHRIEESKVATIKVVQ